MNIKRKSEYIGALGALLVHVAIIALLILVSFAIRIRTSKRGEYLL